jgi:hypothetical protein
MGNPLRDSPFVSEDWNGTVSLRSLEFGGAHLFAGEFMEDAPNSNGEGDATYAYVETVFTF